MKKRPKKGLLAFIATINNNSPSFKLMCFLKIAAFWILRICENVHCSYLALVKKGQSSCTCAGLNCRYRCNFIYCYFWRRRSSNRSRRFPSPERGEFHPMMHHFMLYYQASERTWSYQFNRDATVEQHWKAMCFADASLCTFAVSTFLRFPFYYSKYIFC